MSAHVAGNVWIGRTPNGTEGFQTVIDMTGEMIVSKAAGADLRAFPILDLSAPPADRLRDAAREIEAAQEKGKTLVACALGMQRSAAAVAVWLVGSGYAKNGDEAIALVRKTGRPVHLDAALIDAVLKETP